MKKNLIICTIVVLGIFLLGFTSNVLAENPIFTDRLFGQAALIQARNENALFRLPGVHGVGLGKYFGQAAIVVLVDEQSRESVVPTQIDGIPVIVRKVGRIVAEQINLGVSIGNDILCSGPCSGRTCNFCDGGTVGFKVCDNTVANIGGFITNNHVAVSGCPGKCPNNAPIGTNIVAPGIQTIGCNVAGATNIGTLNRFVNLTLDGSTLNDADAAFVESTDTHVSDNIQGLGLQSNTIASVLGGEAICKSGATTGVTCGQISLVNLTVDVGYDQAGDLSPGPCGTGVGRFRNIIEYEPLPPDTDMSQGGDSGAPVVLNDGSNDAVALHFAGETGGPLGYGIPIGTVLTELDISLCSDIPEPPDADAGGPYEEECEGNTTTVQLSGVASDPDGDTLTILWSSDCPGASFDDATNLTPVLSIDTSNGCFINCTSTLRVTDATDSTVEDTAQVTVRDTLSPVIVCPPDQPIECDQNPNDLTLTGNASAGDQCSGIIESTYSDEYTPGDCPHESTIRRTWTAADDCGNPSSCVQIMNVVDTIPPILSEVPSDVTVECDSVPGPASVKATDNCDTSITVVFSETRTDGSCPSNFTLTRTWTATDACGNSTAATQIITVQDTTAPTINSISALPNKLWPANHKMMPVIVDISASDNCGAPVCSIASVTSNEPENGLGDGDTAPDWEITGDMSVNLRAERSGTGSGRIYSIAITCNDGCGNSSSGTVDITVPHDKRK